MNETNASEWTSLAGLCSLLARLWSREVDQALLESIRRPPLLDALQAFPEWTESLCHEAHCESADQDLLETLAVDYCRIMIGPKDHAAPIQSVWSEGKMAGDVATKMERYQAVVSLPPALVPGIPDHFANQLHILAVILFSSMETVQASIDIEPLSSVRELAGCFVRDHLQWVGPMVRPANRCAKTEFYRGLIRMTTEACEQLASEFLPLNAIEN